MSACVPEEVRGVLESLELQLQDVVSCLMWGLEIQLRASARAATDITTEPFLQRCCVLTVQQRDDEQQDAL